MNTTGAPCPPLRTKNSSVAVVVPCFNAARTLAATLRSVIGQEGVSEIAVIDDGSSDETLAIARRFEPAVTVLTGPNRGVSAARNRGILATSADWLLFLDSDDLLAPETIRLRLETARQHEADVVVSDWEDLIDDGAAMPTVGQLRTIDWPALRLDGERAAATHVWATTAALLYHRSIVERIGGFRADLPVIQDARFLFDAARHGARFVHAAHIGAQYRVLAGSLSRRNPGQFWQDVLVNGRQIETIWRERGAIDEGRLQALADIYNTAARGLFAAGHPAYFEAVDMQRSLGVPVPLHSRLAKPVAGLLGLRVARSLASLMGAS